MNSSTKKSPQSPRLKRGEIVYAKDTRTKVYQGFAKVLSCSKGCTPWDEKVDWAYTLEWLQHIEETDTCIGTVTYSWREEEMERIYSYQLIL